MDEMTMETAFKVVQLIVGIAGSACFCLLAFALVKLTIALSRREQ